MKTNYGQRIVVNAIGKMLMNQPILWELVGYAQVMKFEYYLLFEIIK